MTRPKEKTTIRAFVALDLDAMSVRRVARVADRLRMGSGAPSAVWTPTAKMHVTLRFIGHLPVDAVAPLGKEVGALVVRKRSPLPGSFRLDAFPSVEHARIVVAELEDPQGDLSKLAGRVDRIATKHAGPAAEERSFRPHVTLARLKRPYDSRKWVRPELSGADACRVVGLTLYRSDLGPQGSIYVPLARFEYDDQ
jgi:2'-5' RNA ligase